MKKGNPKKYLLVAAVLLCVGMLLSLIVYFSVPVYEVGFAENINIFREKYRLQAIEAKELPLTNRFFYVLRSQGGSRFVTIVGKLTESAAEALISSSGEKVASGNGTTMMITVPFRDRIPAEVWKQLNAKRVAEANYAFLDHEGQVIEFLKLYHGLTGPYPFTIYLEPQSGRYVAIISIRRY